MIKMLYRSPKRIMQHFWSMVRHDHLLLVANLENYLVQTGRQFTPDPEIESAEPLMSVLTAA